MVNCIYDKHTSTYSNCQCRLGHVLSYCMYVCVQVLPPPVTSQPTVSQHVTPNSTPSQPTAVVDNTSVAGSSTTKPSIMKRGSSVDDESWMYDHVSDCTLLAPVAIVQSILASFALYMRGEGLVHAPGMPEKSWVLVQDITVYQWILLYARHLHNQCVPGPLLLHIWPGNEADRIPEMRTPWYTAHLLLYVTNTFLCL